MHYLSLWGSDLAGNWPAIPIHNRYCFKMFMSTVFFFLCGVAGGRAVNHFAVLLKGPVVVFSAPSTRFKV